MTFWIGLGVGSGAVILVVSVMVLAALARIRRRRRNFTAFSSYVRHEARKTNDQFRSLWKGIEGVKDLDVQIRTKGRKLTSAEQGTVMVINGVDLLVRRTNIDPKVIDALLQMCVDFSLGACEQNEKEPG